MEILVHAVTVILLCGLFVGPVIVIRFLNRENVNYKLIAFLAISGLLTACIVVLLAWWRYTSWELLMTHYGYSFDAWNESDAYANVAPENVDRVKELWNGIMGVGRGFAAMIFYALYSPYLLIVPVTNYVIQRQQRVKA